MGPLLYRLSLNRIKWQCPVHRRTQIRALSHVDTLGDKLSLRCSCFHGRGPRVLRRIEPPPKNIKEETNSEGMKLSTYRSVFSIV